MELYRTSEKILPKKTPEVEYPAHFEVRVVSGNNMIRWRGKWVSVGSALTGERIGLEAVEDGVWAVYFSWKRIGFLDEKKLRILDEYGKLTRKRM